ncbi:hypothetical protein PR048_016162 [Dryococelus australis]|uniref:Uncharacterized protein n=1 Tax=Dryococelus australis TaxID=614101 RepID=A0ABQ9HJE0_9NEOP|nr:hypothetical protein PR048_016162 [Dryococelus australis]
MATRNMKKISSILTDMLSNEMDRVVIKIYDLQTEYDSPTLKKLKVQQYANLKYTCNACENYLLVPALTHSS